MFHVKQYHNNGAPRSFHHIIKPCTMPHKDVFNKNTCESNQTAEFIQALSKKTGIQNENIIIAPGNHDVSRNDVAMGADIKFGYSIYFTVSF